MALRTTCPNCMAVYQLPATQRATRLRCKRCGEVFFVAGLADEPRKHAVTASVPPPAPEEDDVPETERDPARQGSPLLMWVLGIGSLLTVAAIVILVVVLGRDQPNEGQPVVEAPPPAKQHPLEPAKEKVVEEVPKVKPPPEPPPVPREPQPENPPPTAPEVKQPPARKIAFWKVEADPPPGVVGGPEMLDGGIPLPAGARLIYPTTASSFAVVGKPAKMSYSAKIWDLQKMKEVGKLSSPFLLHDEALSPDGKYFAARLVRKDRTVVEVWTVGSDAKPVRLEVDPRPALVALVDFAQPGRIVTAKYGSPNATFQLWDTATGQEKGRFDAPNFVYKMEAFSPGRRYVAVADKEKIMVHDLAAGKQAGEVAFPKGYDSLRGLAFSPDGKELAVLLEHQQRAHLISWDVAAGEVIREHRWDKGPHLLAQQSTLSHAPGLMWLQGHSGWLVLGQVLVEHTTGQHTLMFPAAVNDTTLGTRRLLGPGHLVTASGFPGKQQLTIMPLPAAQIASLLNVVREDALAPPLPPAKVATWAGVRLLSPPAAEVPWHPTADPAPAARAAPQWRIPLRWGDETEQLLFSAPQVGHAAVLSLVKPGSPSAPPQVRVDRYDLTSGKFLGGRPLFPVSIDQRQRTVKGDLSPDGKWLVVQHPADGRRLDVWSVSEGKHEAAWMPCATDTEPGGKPRWVALLDGGRVLTLSERGRLTLWQLPECRALYTLEGIRGAVALSPGRNYLAAHDGSAFQLLATADGACKGRQLLPDDVAGGLAVASAFAPDGETLIINLSVADKSFQKRSVLSRRHLRDGRVNAVIPIPAEEGERLVVYSHRHTLAGRTVVDWTLRAPVCTYRSALPRLLERAGLPDGKCWVGNEAGGRPILLTVRSLPDGEMGALLARLGAGQAQVVLAPGAAVAVNVPAGPPGFQEQATRGLTDQLKQQGFELAADGGTRVNVHIDEKTNGSYTLVSLDGKNNTIQMPIYELAVTVDVTDATGKKLKELATGTFRTRQPGPGFVVVGDPAPPARSDPYGRCAQWLRGVTLPVLVVRDGDRYRTLPEPTDFKMDGP